jgi:8-oxo-dGTP pyrophosphatase MutT (NUDIX family)
MIGGSEYDTDRVNQLFLSAKGNSMSLIGSIALIPLGDGMFQGIKCAKGRGISLPGGKWQPGETFRDTAIRETKEEVGLDVDAYRLLYQGPSPDGYIVHCFLCRKTYPQQQAITSKEGWPIVTTWKHLMQSEFGPYYDIVKEIYARCK